MKRKWSTPTVNLTHLNDPMWYEIKGSDESKQEFNFG